MSSINMNRKSGLYGFGINDADYPIKSRVDGKCVIVPEYSRWISVVQRSNDPKEKARKQSYEDVYCSEKWKYFTDFSDWLHTQPYWQELFLDKDILFPGNKEYGPDTCVFVPGYINMITIISNNQKTVNPLPVGVSKTRSGTYQARYGSKCLGNSKTPEESHKRWQLAKADAIYEAVEKYATEPWFRTDVADALMARVWKLRLDSFNGVLTTYI